MKYLLMFLITTSINATEITIDKVEETLSDKVYTIHKLMVDLEDKLNDDRHDTSVQIAGQEIEEEIKKLIKDVEDNENKQNNNNSKIPSEKKTKQIPAPDSKIKKTKYGEVIQREVPLWETKDYYNNWVKIGEIRREGITQTYNDFEKIPILWQKRISAYFLSIAESDPEVIKNRKRMERAHRKAVEDRIEADLAKQYDK